MTHPRCAQAPLTAPLVPLRLPVRASGVSGRAGPGDGHGFRTPPPSCAGLIKQAATRSGDRRGWIVDRIQQLAGIFAIDVAGYGVMSNHYHMVVRIDAEWAADWNTDEVLARWTTLFPGPLLIQRYLEEGRSKLSEGDVLAVDRLAEPYRKRLADLSWFMRTLNEAIARWANAEEGVWGRFWEGRFKSQALLDEAALVAALASSTSTPSGGGRADAGRFRLHGPPAAAGLHV